MHSSTAANGSYKDPRDQTAEPPPDDDAVEPSSPPPPVEKPSSLAVARGMLRTIRPHQWVKNVFVLAPVVFAENLFDPSRLTRAAGAFLVFCLLAGAVYTINDLADVEADRRHPIKRRRPIASGQVPVPAARLLAATLIVLSLLGSYVALAALPLPGAAAPYAFVLVAAGYFLMNLAYSARLKHVAYVDVGCISLGFVLRVLAGGFAAGLHVSTYLLLCTALLASFLGFGKRRHELSAARTNAKQQRAALDDYTTRGLDLALTLTAITTVGTYLAYTLDPKTRAQFQSDWLWVSTLFVVLGVWRFLHLVRNRPKSESPTQEMLRDGPFVGIVLLWVGLVLWVVYHLHPGGV